MNMNFAQGRTKHQSNKSKDNITMIKCQFGKELEYRLIWLEAPI